MKSLQLALLVAFGLFAALTAFLQVRYGMITGRSECSDPQSDPKAKACSRRATMCAIAAGVSLVLCVLVGVMNRMNG
ncbi:MAG: hypothetical protein ACOYIE_05760 [Agathobaculum sp.]|jgi:hypothetical protein|uniref:hypothetical protein n=1 Tax=Agathobaculum sp. TaxID=2048138 RepID=UPI003D8A43FA